MFNATIANNGADLTQARNASGFVGQMPAASVVPSSVIASQVPLPCASNAATAQGCTVARLSLPNLDLWYQGAYSSS